MGSPRILVVEDHAVNRLVMTRLLDKLGYVADVVVNGVEAVDAVQRVGYDAVLMDVQMPELDGYGATRRIRAFEENERRDRVPIIAMTASAVAGERERCLAAGMDDYLAKPVRADDLAGTLQRWIAAQRPVSAPDEATIDAEQVDMLREVYDEPAALREAIAMFAAGLREVVQGLGDAVRAGDATRARRLAHSLAGSAGTLGASALAAQARTVEAALERGDAGTAEAKAAVLADLCNRSVARLTALVDR